MTPGLQIRPFEPLHAATVAAWVRSDLELAWLSPESAFPLTAAKVIAWGGHNRRQFLFRRPTSAAPIAYAELNDMPGRPEQQWIGHLLLDPKDRGRALGLACVNSLLSVAFDDLSADEVVLVVVPENQPAVRCYQRAGLVQAGDEWKRPLPTDQPYRLLRMCIDRARYLQLQAAGQSPRMHAATIPAA